MTSLYDILKANRLGMDSDPWIAILGEAWKASEEEFKEYTGLVPYTFIANGQPLIDWYIKGNMSQTGTPAPTTPITPSECGDRTENLLNTAGAQSGYISENGSITQGHDNLMYTDYIPIPDSAEYITQSATYTMLSPAMCFYDGNKDFISGEAFRSASTKTFDIPNNAKYIRTSYRTGSSFGKTMLNAGSQPLPYEPYGYVLPVKTGSTTTPVYLGEVQTERKIRKLVLTGEETIDIDTYLRFSILIRDIKISNTSRTERSYCSHYECLYHAEPYDNDWNNVYYQSVKTLFFHDRRFATVTDFKTYLQQQYANGTPVTVWYVLSSATTGILNEPIRKIGEYADTLTATQAGVEIPTNNGSTTLDVPTTLKPSEVYIKYKGR